ncbi:LacI family DNA-binding transcriptional regulator [Amycolatopsis sp. NPDC101161]|uniref:LacI family DNA-binding transcriptional regulator n=1 Tax=Amycolatopsis sp. NPDC101161 TaxID=3363940 RepID=UPI00380973F8
MERVTISDVADASGVSRATVSLVVRGSSKISPQTTERVRATMMRLGYVYNRQAANLRTQRTMTMGLILPGVRDPWFADLTMAIEEQAEAAGCTLLTGYSRDQPERENRLLATMVEQRVDGVVLLPASQSRGRGLAEIVGGRTAPHVVIDRWLPYHRSDFIGVDNVSAAVEVADHLVSLGVRRVAYVGGPPDCVVRAEREEGLRLGLEEHGLDLDAASYVDVDLEQAGGSQATRNLLAGGQPPDAIVAYADSVALGVIAELQRQGVRPGQDVAVVGFDDIDAASVHHPTLTTVATFPGRLGEQAVKALLARISHPQAALVKTRFEARLHIRETTTLWSRKAA